MAATDPSSTEPAGGGRWLSTLAVTALSIVVFSGSLYLYTRHNDFPMRYHPDESGKVDQILSADQHRNYHHPQLLLEVSDLLLNRWPTDDPQQAVQIGRLASALCAALTAVAAALLGYGVGRLRGMLILAAMLLFSPPLILYSHYMKEDTPLMLGIVLCLLASRVFWGKPLRRWRDPETNERRVTPTRAGWRDLLAVGFMGMACAVAMSGKYVGVYTVAALLPLLFFPRGHWNLIPLRPLIFLLFTVGVALIINRLIFKDWDGFTQSLESETHHGMTQHFELAMDVPTGFFIRDMWENATSPVKCLAVLYLPLLLITWKRRSGWDLFPIFFLAVSTAVISRCPIPFTRYGLPMVITLYVMAGIAGCFAVDAVEMAVGLLPRRHELRARDRWAPIASGLTAGAILVFVLAVHVPLCRDTLDQFGHDSREGLREWLIKNGEPGASIAADFYAGLRDDGRPNRPSAGWHGFAVAPEWYGFAPQVAGWGNLWNFRYIAICSVAYERYMIPEAHGYGDTEEDFAMCKQFYRTLIDRCTPVWKSVPDHPLHAYTNPTIYLYDTTKLPADIR